MTVLLSEPVPRDLQRRLRGVVLDHGQRERRRRRFPTTLHVAGPDTPAACFEPGAGAVDDALRTDVVGALLARARSCEPLVWLARPGTLEPQASDLAWHRAAAGSGAELGLAVRMVVVVRHGWYDPATGVGRSWVRLRPRGAGR